MLKSVLLFHHPNEVKPAVLKSIVKYTLIFAGFDIRSFKKYLHEFNWQGDIDKLYEIYQSLEQKKHQFIFLSKDPDDTRINFDLLIK